MKIIILIAYEISNLKENIHIFKNLSLYNNYLQDIIQYENRLDIMLQSKIKNLLQINLQQIKTFNNKDDQIINVLTTTDTSSSSSSFDIHHLMEIYHFIK